VRTRFLSLAAGIFAGLMTLMPASQALADKIKNPTAVFSGLDKITGRTISFEVAIDETVQDRPEEQREGQKLTQAAPKVAEEKG